MKNSLPRKMAALPSGPGSRVQLVFFPPAMGSGASSKKQFLFQHYRRISVVSCFNRFIDGFITYTYNYNMEVS